MTEMSVFSTFFNFAILLFFFLFFNLLASLVFSELRLLPAGAMFEIRKAGGSADGSALRFLRVSPFGQVRCDDCEEGRGNPVEEIRIELSARIQRLEMSLELRAWKLAKTSLFMA